MSDANKIINHNNLLIMLVTSIITALSAYIIVFFFVNYASFFFANDFGIHALLNLNGISFPDWSDHVIWSRDALITILLSKPIAAFGGGLAFFVILMMGIKKPSSIVLLLFWLNVFAFNLAFGVLIDDAITGTGTYEVATAMNIDNTYLLIMSIIFAFILFKIGIMDGRLINISFPDSSPLIKLRLEFFIVVIVIPAVLVILFTYFFTDSIDSFYKILKYLPLLVLLMPALKVKEIEDAQMKYLPAKSFSVTDVVILCLLLITAIILIIVMKNGIVIN